MRFLLFCLFLSVSFASFANSVTVKQMRVWSAPESTRVVFDITHQMDYQVFTLDNPNRLVIDLKNTVLAHNISKPKIKGEYLKKIRVSRHQQKDLRIVLDMNTSFSYKSFTLEPNQHYAHRLVIDLYDESDKQRIEPNKKTKHIVKQEPEDKRDVIIAVDAGHGGEDPGAIGPGGNYEKDIVLKIARKLSKRINQEVGMRSVLIRDGDYFIPLRERMVRARNHKADLFISIHADAFRDSRVRGSSVYVLSKRGASSEAARWLAESENASDLVGGVSLDERDDVLASVLLDLSQSASLEASIDVAERVLSGLKRVGKVHQRRVQSAGFMVLKSPDIPSVLVETAFISNPQEEEKLLSHRYQDNLVEAILGGVKSYFYDFAPYGSLIASLQAGKHVIKDGENLFVIAKKYNLSINKLREFNHLKSDRLKVGQTLAIPKAQQTDT